MKSGKKSDWELRCGITGFSAVYFSADISNMIFFPVSKCNSFLHFDNRPLITLSSIAFGNNL